MSPQSGWELTPKQASKPKVFGGGKQQAAELALPLGCVTLLAVAITA
jgi:hypothetical protein